MPRCSPSTQLSSRNRGRLESVTRDKRRELCPPCKPGGHAVIFFHHASKHGINIELISTSEIKISVVIDLDRADDAARVAHTAFQLDRA